MTREENTRAILTGAIFVAVFVILLVSIGSAADLVSAPNAQLPPIGPRIRI
jgi:hypothetical protein